MNETCGQQHEQEVYAEHQRDDTQHHQRRQECILDGGLSKLDNACCDDSEHRRLEDEQHVVDLRHVAVGHIQVTQDNHDGRAGDDERQACKDTADDAALEIANVDGELQRLGPWQHMAERHDIGKAVFRQPVRTLDHIVEHHSDMRDGATDVDETALAGAPGRALLQQLGPRQRDHVERMGSRPLEQVLDEVEQAANYNIQYAVKHACAIIRHGLPDARDHRRHPRCRSGHEAFAHHEVPAQGDATRRAQAGRPIRRRGINRRGHAARAVRHGAGQRLDRESF